METKKNVTELEMQFNWLREIVLFRLYSSMEISFNELLNQIPLPQFNKENKFGELFIKLRAEYKLTSEEHFVLLLSLSPYYIPEFFSHNLDKNDKQIHIGNSLLLNKSLVSNIYMPTIDTALCLLCGENISDRQKYFPLFLNESKLFKEDLLEKSIPPSGEPFTRSVIVPSQNLLSGVITGETKGPEFSHDFPATLLMADYEWSDLIIDYNTRLQLEEVKEWLDYENLCKQKNTGPDKFRKGYKCLFTGPPGTGKTLAASLIGKLTGRRIYRIDLSAVVSKYIGETEKNLAKIFDRAAHGNWILFFDEADALFGKRGATQNAHDRYANQEVSYLLQRFESYEGVSILASNFKDNIDSAFYRRFHSIVKFKVPEAEERVQLWKVHLPEGFNFEEEIDLNEISQRIKITGAGIYNVMRRSCMKAVLNGDNIIRGKDMYMSIKQEFAKENKTL
jgi:hypothetical protein